jgi:hypothetical protein
MKFELVHNLETDPETFWKVFFDEEYNVALHTKAIKVKERTLLELTEDDHSITRRVRVTPDDDIPAAFQKIVGGDTTYVETTTWKKGSDECQITVELTAERLRPKFSFIGKMKVSTQGTRLRRDFTGELKVDIMLVGGKIEKTVYNGIERDDKAAEPFMAEWLRNL